MADDDRTVDADPAAMEELRRFAEEARAAAAGASARLAADGDANGHTVEADGSEMEMLRRYAEQARRGLGAEPTIDLPPSGPSFDPPIAPGEVAPSLADLPSLPTADSWRAPAQPKPVSAPPPPLPEHTVQRSPAARPVAAPPEPPSANGQPWRPPDRMVMPTKPEKRVDVHHGPWRAIALVLAGVVAVLLAVFAIGALTGSNGDEPPTDSVPGNSAEIVGDDLGGSGGGG